MSDRLTREFRAQLTTHMDSVMRNAVFEVMKIFENSLHDHQMELAHKSEEIAQLKIKLQRTEITLRERECGGVGAVTEMDKTLSIEWKGESDSVLSASEQTYDVPEIDFEVPDDWCAPLGCETVPKQEDVCPSVRLRQLYIPLWHIPIIKQEDEHCEIESQKTKHTRRSRRVPFLKENPKDNKDRSSPMSVQGPRRGPLRNDMKLLLQDIKREYADLRSLRRGGKHSTGKAEKEKLKNKRKERKKSTVYKSSVKKEKVEINEKTYSCKFCKKEFDTSFGRSVHIRSHKTCRGCKKEFPFPSVLQCHKPYCPKLQKLLSKKAQSTDTAKPQSSKEEKPSAPGRQEVIFTKESRPSSSCYRESSTQRNRRAKGHSCLHCSKRFGSRTRMKAHLRFHTEERPFSCTICSKTFRLNQSLKLHMTRIHKGRMDASETNGGLSWTIPLEATGDNQEHPVSPSKDTSGAINHNKVNRKCNPQRKRGARWKTMGRLCPEGFACLLCKKITRNKYLLEEHFRVHTAETPFECDSCPAKFRSYAQRRMHKQRCGDHMIQCEKCERKYPSKESYEKHMNRCHRELPLFCKVCGKGFVLEGRLKNHMQLHG